MESDEKWCLIAPFAHSALDELIPGSLPIIPDVSLTTMPEWLDAFRLSRELDADALEYIENCQFAFVAEYPGHAFFDVGPGLSREGEQTFVDLAFEKLDLANLMFWLVRPSRMTLDYFFLAFYSARTWHILQYFRSQPFQLSDEDVQTKYSHEDFQTATSLMASLVSVPDQSPVWIALKAFREGLRDKWWQSRYLLYWVALESLFGPKDAREINYRLAVRISLFLQGPDLPARDLFRATKLGYGLRSKVVHGLSVKKKDTVISHLLLRVTEGLIRRSLRRLILDKDLVSKLSSKEREQYLDALVFDDNK